MTAARTARLNQYALDFGPREHIRLIHGSPQARASHVAIAVNGESWREQCYPLATAPEQAEQLAALEAADVYMSQNGMAPFRRRSVANVVHLNACFVDLDTYQIPGLGGLSYPERLQAVMANAGDLPLPTLAADSGRGIYLVWALKAPFFIGTDKGSGTAQAGLRAKYLGRWQRVEDLLIRRLADFGADPKARDAARVLRLAGSVNQRNGRAVSYSQLAHPIAFDELERPLLKWYEQAHPTPAKPPRGQRQPRENNGQTVRQLLNARTLAASRMADLNTLSGLRHGLSDRRGRALFAFAQAAADFCHDERSLITECQQYAAECFNDPHGKYAPERLPARLGAVLARFRESVGHSGTSEHNKRYKLTNARIIEDLAITEQEQGHMLALIGKDEKRRRNTKNKREKRRAQGIRPAGEYQQERQRTQTERRQRARELAAQGLSRQQVADRLGVSKRTVQLILNTQP